MNIKKTTLDIKVTTHRPEDQKRLYSNYVEVSTTESDVSIRFSDLKPPHNEEEVKRIEKDGSISIPVNAEIVIPTNIAKQLLTILKQHLEIPKK